MSSVAAHMSLVRRRPGFGLKRLVDLPMAWPDQWRTLGLRTPAWRKERSTLACLSSGDELSYPIRTG
jgi:hypothetical protein